MGQNTKFSTCHEKENIFYLCYSPTPLKTCVLGRKVNISGQKSMLCEHTDCPSEVLTTREDLFQLLQWDSLSFLESFGPFCSQIPSPDLVICPTE